MGYSKAEREAAAILCSAMADWWARPGIAAPDPFLWTDGNRAERLAIDASRAANVVRTPFTKRNVSIAEDWADAEALIRTGWEPSP